MASRHIYRHRNANLCVQYIDKARYASVKKSPAETCTLQNKYQKIPRTEPHACKKAVHVPPFPIAFMALMHEVSAMLVG